MPRKAEQKVTDSMIRGEVYKRLEIAESNPGWVGALSTAVPSGSDSEEYMNMDRAPVLKPRQSGDEPSRPTAQTWTIINQEYTASAAIPARLLRRDIGGWFDRYLGDVGKAAVTHWRRLLTDLLEVGTTTTITSDSQNFFDTAHVYGDSSVTGSQNNNIAAAQVSDLNVTTANDPTAVELMDAVLGTIGHFFGFKDANNEPFWEDNKEFHIMLPHNMAAAAAKAFGKELLNNGTGTEENALVNGEYRVTYSINRRLATSGGADAVFYAFVTDTQNKPMMRQSEMIPGAGPDDVLVDTFGPGSEYFRLNEEMLVKLQASRNVGFTHNWEGAIRATLS